MNAVVDKECPICVTVPPGKIFQCKEGHIICEPCLLKLRERAELAKNPARCPSCAGKMDEASASRNRVLENMLDRMMFNCHYPSCDGILKRSQLKDHETTCVYGVQFNICELLGIGCNNFKLSVGNSCHVKRHLLTCHHYYNWIYQFPVVSDTWNAKALWEGALAGRNGVQAYLMEPWKGPATVLVLIKCTQNCFSFYFIDLSLSLPPDHNHQVTFSIPSENAPFASWSFTGYGGVGSWGYFRDKNTPGHFEVGVNTILQHCDEAGMVPLDIRIEPW